MVDYTKEFGESWELVGHIVADAHATEQNIEVAMKNYTRVVFLGSGKSGTGETIDVDVEESATSGGALSSHDSGAKDLTIGDTDVSFKIEVRSAELASGMEYLNLEVTPSGARACSVIALGLKKNRPATNNFAQSAT